MMERSLPTPYRPRFAVQWILVPTKILLFQSTILVRISVLILALFVITGLLGPWLMPHDPNFIDLTGRYEPPMWQDGGSAEHPLGTDSLGRDILSRLIDGSRISLALCVASILIAGVIGTTVGLVAGVGAGIPGSAVGKIADVLLMRFTDLVLAVPIILIALLLAVIFGPSYRVIITVTVTFLWAAYARVVRTESVSICGHAYIDLALLAGMSRFSIALRHVLPNLLATLVVLVTLQVGFVILFTSALSFLGAGVPAPQATWGGMVSDGRSFLNRAWWISTIPGLVIALVVFAANTLGDWLRDRLDPRLSGMESW